MSTTRFADPNDVPFEALRLLTRLDNAQLDFAKAYLECSDDLRRVVHEMFAVLDSEEATREERERAMATIADALFLRPHKQKYGMDLVASESEATEQVPALGREAQRMDEEEATFAERLRTLLERRTITQTELAERTGCSQSAISHMLNRNSRPQKKTILKLAEALQVAPVDLWPDLEVAVILDAVSEFQQEQELAPAQANAVRDVMDRTPAKVRGRRLRSRKPSG